MFKLMLNQVIKLIKVEFKGCLEEFNCYGCFLEVQWLEQCIMFDLEMLEVIGFCVGIENYLCYLIGCKLGELFFILFEYLFDNVIVFVDESYVIILQIGVMYWGDFCCKVIFVEYGFRFFSCMDNWLLCFEEWNVMWLQFIVVLVILGLWEMEEVGGVFVEQVICLIGLVDLFVDICLVISQVDDFLGEVCEVV